MLTRIKQYWLSLGISAKISIGLSSIVLGSLFVALGGIYQNNITSSKLNRVTSTLLPATLLTQTCVTAFDEQLKHYEDTLLTGDEMFLLAAQEKSKLVQQALEQLTPLISNGNIKPIDIQRLQQNFNTYTTTANQIFEQIIASDADINESINDQTFALATQAHTIREHFSNYNLLVKHALEQELQEIGILSTQFSSMGTIIFSIALALAIGIATLFTKVITRPIVALATNAQLISQGEWRNNLKAVGNDEIAILTRTFSTMVKNTQQRTLELLRVNTNLRQEIVDRKSAEEEKRILEKQLIHAEKMRSLGTMAGGIAHDFNNLLTPIIGFSELIQFSLEDHDEQNKQRINEILQAGKRGKDMIQQIMEFSRQGSSEKVAVDLASLVAEAITQLRTSIPPTITINHNIDTNIGMVLADSTQIHQILMNLGINASHAIGDKEGIISINVSPVVITHQKNTPYNIKLGAYISITMQDTGSGIDQEHIDHIFDPFFTTKKQGKGTGLGLTMVHSIVTDHDGSIMVESSLGKGTCFKILLPKVSETKENKTDKGEDSVIKHQGYGQILIVDDDEQVVKILAEILTVAGYSITTSTDSHEVPKLFSQDINRFDLMITDMRMPIMNGRELSQTILDLRPDMPIIMCSGYTEEAEKQGPWSFLPKPISSKTLIAAVQQQLKQ